MDPNEVSHLDLLRLIYVAPCGVELHSPVVLDRDISSGTRLDLGL